MPKNDYGAKADEIMSDIWGEDFSKASSNKNDQKSRGEGVTTVLVKENETSNKLKPKEKVSVVPKGKKSENRKIGKSENRKIGNNSVLARYEVRPDSNLDYRLRKFMFDTRSKTNETLVEALDVFLKQRGY